MRLGKDPANTEQGHATICWHSQAAENAMRLVKMSVGNIRITLFMVGLLSLVNIFFIGPGIGTSPGEVDKPSSNEPKNYVQRFKEMTKILESSSIRYYVYDNKNVSLPHIRDRAKNNLKMTWRARWGRRFATYALGEIRWLEALEGHPLRTMDPAEAVFFIVPIPISAVLMWGSKEDFRDAFETILNGALFQQHRKRHVVAIATSERVWGWNWWGLSDETMKRFNQSMIIRDANRALHDKWQTENDKVRCLENDRGAEIFSKEVSLGFGGEESNPQHAFQPVTMESWNQKQFWFFFHIRPEKFICDSDEIRRAFTKNSTNPSLMQHQPVSIGTGLPYEEWKQTFENSKFCLVVRGDNPGSRAMFRSIRTGCIPLVISDPLPSYQPLYERTLQYDDWTLIVKEDDFMEDPIGSLDNAVSALSPTDITRKIEGLRLMQRIVAVDQPESLFVQAVSREIVEAMKENGLTSEKVGSLILQNTTEFP